MNVEDINRRIQKLRKISPRCSNRICNYCDLTQFGSLLQGLMGPYHKVFKKEKLELEVSSALTYAYR